MNRMGVRFRLTRKIRRLNIPASVIVRLSIAIFFFLLAGGAGVLGCEYHTNPAIRTFASAYAAVVSNSVIGFGDIAPRTNCGKTVALTARGVSLLAFAGLVGATSAVLAEGSRRRRKGLARVKEEGHIIIAGWNPVETPSLVQALIDGGNEESVVIVSSLIDELPFEHPRVKFVHGAPSRKEVLESANIKEAKAVLIPARDANDPASDAHALLISRWVKHLVPDMFISVEVVSPANSEHFPDDCAVMPINRMASQMMAQSINDQGVEQLIEQLISPNDGATLYRIALPEGLEGKTFKEMLHWSAEHAGLAIGLARGGETMLNPPRDSQVRKGDHIFVISNKRPKGAAN